MRVWSDNLEGLFERAAKGMISLVVRSGSCKRNIEKSLSVEAESLEELMLLWLREILYFLERDSLLFSRFRVSVREKSSTEGYKYQIIGTLKGFKVDLSRHEICLEIKAITRHCLSVHRTAGGWEADILFDV